MQIQVIRSSSLCSKVKLWHKDKDHVEIPDPFVKVGNQVAKGSWLQLTTHFSTDCGHQPTGAIIIGEKMPPWALVWQTTAVLCSTPAVAATILTCDCGLFSPPFCSLLQRNCSEAARRSHFHRLRVLGEWGRLEAVRQQKQAVKMCCSSHCTCRVCRITFQRYLYYPQAETQRCPGLLCGSSSFPLCPLCLGGGAKDQRSSFSTMGPPLFCM